MFDKLMYLAKLLGRREAAILLLKADNGSNEAINEASHFYNRAKRDFLDECNRIVEQIRAEERAGHGEPQNVDEWLDRPEKPVMVQCHICAKEAPLERAIEDEGWFPSYWDGDAEVPDPVCGDCAEKMDMSSGAPHVIPPLGVLATNNEPLPCISCGRTDGYSNSDCPNCGAIVRDRR